MMSAPILIGNRANIARGIWLSSTPAPGIIARLCMVVSANFFQTYGAQPALGRAFLPGVEDRDPGAHPVAVISHGLWADHYG